MAFNDPTDFHTQAKVVALYHGTFEIAPVLHQALTGNGLCALYLATLGGEILGAATLKSPEVVMPTGHGVRPFAWVVSDVIVAPGARRRGIGLGLMRSLEGEVVRQGGRIIYLHTQGNNEAAIRLYVKAGYRRLRPQGSNVAFVKLIEE